MNRQTKYRAWDGKSIRYDITGFEYDRDKGMQFVYLSGDAYTLQGIISIPEAKLMQFTGLQDSNGIDIYEGDIVDFTFWWFNGSERESHLLGTIVYSDEFMSFQLKGVINDEWEKFTGCKNDTEYLTPFSELNFVDADFEVIGNIHQNRDLLEREVAV